MDDSTSHGPWTYPGDADAAAGGASDLFAREGDGYKDLEDLRAFDLRELARCALEDAEGGLWAWGPIEGVPRRQAHALDSSLPGEGAVPVRLRNGFAAAADWSSIMW
jgi:hypothetical protein